MNIKNYLVLGTTGLLFQLGSVMALDTGHTFYLKVINHAPRAATILTDVSKEKCVAGTKKIKVYPSGRPASITTLQTWPDCYASTFKVKFYQNTKEKEIGTFSFDRHHSKSAPGWHWKDQSAVDGSRLSLKVDGSWSENTRYYVVTISNK